MNALDALTPIAVAASVAVASLNTASLINKAGTPPPIEGSAAYNDPVRPGENIRVTWEIFKRTECDGELSRVWRGEDGFHLAEVRREAALPKTEGVQIFNIQTHIPDLAPPGRLELEIHGSYYCNQRRDFTLGPVVFEVIE